MEKRLIVDMSSVMWRALLVGEDKEFGKVVEFEGKSVKVNSAKYGYENATNILVAALEKFDIAPMNMIMVHDGYNAKAIRQGMLPDYKASRSSRPPEAYAAFNELKVMLQDAFCGVGAQVAWQDSSERNPMHGMEADDVIGYLCKHLDGKKVVLTTDGDLAVLVDEHTSLYRMDKVEEGNPYGPFQNRHIRLYKAMVGDTSDNIKGAKGFGEKAWLDLLVNSDDADLDWIAECIDDAKSEELAGAVPMFKPLQKVIDNMNYVSRCYAVAGLLINEVNTLRGPLKWRVGMPLPATDERLKKWAQQVRIVTSANYEQAKAFVLAKSGETPYFSLDLETTVPEESDEWLAQRGKKGGVDVIASTIVSCGLSFGSNGQYGLYFSVNHRDTDNITLDQLSDLLALLPQDKLTVAHNAAGFELPVMFNAWGSKWKDNGWRGFFPNMVDSRIAASYWDENQPTHGLKHLSKAVLGYDQTTYAEVTQGRKMDEMSATETVAYGVDDVFTAFALFNHFRTVMEIEGSYKAFMEFEQLPMYLSAKGYVDGIYMDMSRLNELKQADDERYAKHEKVLVDYLISKGWDGTQCPVLTELTPASIKEAVAIVCSGVEFKCAFRKLDRLAIAVSEIDHRNAENLAKAIDDGDLALINRMIAANFSGKPNFDVASPKQVSKLVYGTIGIEVRLRNKVTLTARMKGVTEGTPKTDDDALNMAIKMGDVTGVEADLFKALIEMKGINTARGLYYEPYPNFVHWKTGRVHPELRQSSTVTRRYTSANPNVQQLDSSFRGIRSVIVPHKRDAVIVSLDQGSQEVRAMADLCKDANLASCYVGDKDQLRDVHSIVASKVAGTTYEEFRKLLKSGDEVTALEANRVRQRAKITLFSWAYSATARKIGETLGIPEAEAQEYIDALNAQFPDLGRWKSEIESITEKRGYAPLMHGTRRHLANAILSPDGFERSKAKRQGPNAAIQSSCALQLKKVMSGIWASDLLDSYDLKWYMPVHDELVVSIASADCSEAISKLHLIMCNQFLEAIPSSSSIGLGRSFGELVELGEVFDSCQVNKTVIDISSKTD